MNKHPSTADFESAPGGAAQFPLGGGGRLAVHLHVGRDARFFIYSERQLLKNVRRVKSAATAVRLMGRVSLYVGFFPNANPHVLHPLQQQRVGVLVKCQRNTKY
ncbi:small molecule metabolism amino acid biosynthesis lysine [Candidatus Paraburkholderia calva]|nr:small molecule metabolism amino acid biosynthesis lysine [Candidatus Paraburkholderia calva]